MELINSVTGTDDDGRSRQRVLTFAAKRYCPFTENKAQIVYNLTLCFLVWNYVMSATRAFFLIVFRNCNLHLNSAGMLVQ